MLIVVLFPCLVDPHQLGERLLFACRFGSEKDAIQLLEEGEWICSVIVCTCVCVSKLNIFSPCYMMACKMITNGLQITLNYVMHARVSQLNIFSPLYMMTCKVIPNGM